MAFNSAPFHGKKARIEKNNVAVEFTGGYTWNAGVAMADSSRQGQDWEESKAGQGNWGGNFKGHLVAGNTEQKALIDNIIAATPGTLLTDVKFLLDASTNAFEGDIYITAMRVNADLGSVVAVEFTVKGNGAPTLTDAA